MRQPLRRASQSRVCARRVSAKDLALGMIVRIGTGAAAAVVLEYAGPAVRPLSMEERFTLCNMGSKRAPVRPSSRRIRRHSKSARRPIAARFRCGGHCLGGLKTDVGSNFHQEFFLDAATWPRRSAGAPIPRTTIGRGRDDSRIDMAAPPQKRESAARALAYMDLRLVSIFWACPFNTSSLARVPIAVVRLICCAGRSRRRVAAHVRALVCPDQL